MTFISNVPYHFYDGPVALTTNLCCVHWGLTTRRALVSTVRAEAGAPHGKALPSGSSRSLDPNQGARKQTSAGADTNHFVRSGKGL